MSRKAKAEAQKLRQVEGVASVSSFGKKPSILLGKRTQRGRPPKATGKEVRAQSVTPAGRTAELLRLQSENELLKGEVQLLEDQVRDRDAQLVAARCEGQRAHELLK